MAVEVSFSDLSCQDCNAALKKYRGCNEKPTSPYIFEGKDLERCPIKLIYPSSKWIIRSYWFFRKGFLPFSGSYLNQPAKLIECWEIIEQKEAKLKRERNA